MKGVAHTPAPQGVCGIEISTGAVCNLQERLAEALDIPAEEVLAALRGSTVVHQDETSWRECNEKAWMWVIVDGWYAYYKIAESRSMKVAESLLGGRNFPGDVCTDRYKGYRCYPMEKRIICHAHLGRDYQKIVDRGGVGKPIGEQLIKQEAHLFEAWYEFKDGKTKTAKLTDPHSRVSVHPLRAKRNLMTPT